MYIQLYIILFYDMHSIVCFHVYSNFRVDFKLRNPLSYLVRSSCVVNIGRYLKEGRKCLFFVLN